LDTEERDIKKGGGRASKGELHKYRGKEAAFTRMRKDEIRGKKN